VDDPHVLSGMVVLDGIGRTGAAAQVTKVSFGPDVVNHSGQAPAV